jgi:hypothetical protein
LQILFAVICLFVYLSIYWNAGLENVWDVKPLVNGKDIMSVLQLKAGGPLIREWVSHSFSLTLFLESGEGREVSLGPGE